MGVEPVHAAQNQPSPKMHMSAYFQDTSLCMFPIAALNQGVPVHNHFPTPYTSQTKRSCAIHHSSQLDGSQHLFQLPLSETSHP